MQPLWHYKVLGGRPSAPQFWSGLGHCVRWRMLLGITSGSGVDERSRRHPEQHVQITGLLASDWKLRRSLGTLLSSALVVKQLHSVALPASKCLQPPMLQVQLDVQASRKSPTTTLQWRTTLQCQAVSSPSVSAWLHGWWVAPCPIIRWHCEWDEGPIPCRPVWPRELYSTLHTEVHLPAPKSNPPVWLAWRFAVLWGRIDPPNKPKSPGPLKAHALYHPMHGCKLLHMLGGRPPFDVQRKGVEKCGPWYATAEEWLGWRVDVGAVEIHDPGPNPRVQFF